MENKSNTRLIPNLGIVAIVIIISLFAILISLNSYHLRNKIRHQIITRDSEILYPVTVLQISKVKERLLYEPWSFDSDIDLLSVVLDASEIKGVVSVRLFNLDGKITEAVPRTFTKGELSFADLEQIKNLNPLSRFHADTILAGFTDGITKKDTTAVIPLLEVIIPLHANDSSNLQGIAQFLIDGTDIKNEFLKLDKNLVQQSVIIFVSGSIIITLVLVWSFYRLNATNQLLIERSERLQSANRDLNLAAKTSAVGAITAHVLHGLSNPLSGIREYVNSEDESNTHLAKESTQKMELMIHEIIAMLQEDADANNYDYMLDEIFEIAKNKSEGQASKKGIAISIDKSVERKFENHRSNILIMILMNLIQNAIDAISSGGIITLSSEANSDQIDINISDTGHGIPDEIKDNLFRPVKSKKQNGNGIGLSISRQLARHLGGELSLLSTDQTGTCFGISLPLSEDNLYDKGSIQT